MLEGTMLAVLWASLSFLLVIALHRIYLRVTRTARLRRYFHGRHVWVVGASQGIGRAMCLRLHDFGARLTISSRTVSALDKIRSACGGERCCRVLLLDVSAGSETVRKAWSIANESSRVDDLILNAGINQQGKQFTALSAANIDQVLNTNLVGVTHLCHAAASAMRCGTICVVSSLAAYRGLPGGSVYGATKAAVTSLCTSINIELLARGNRLLRAIAVHPGFVDTPAIRGLDHPKPFLMSESSAAELILDAIACGKRHYGFPWIMEHVVAPFQCALPSPLYEHVISRV